MQVSLLMKSIIVILETKRTIPSLREEKKEDYQFMMGSKTVATALEDHLWRIKII